MKSTILLFLLLNSLCLFAQVVHEKAKILKSENIKIDSIQVQIFVYEGNAFVTESYFEKNKSKLSVVYSGYGKSSYQISTRENSAMPEDFWRTNTFKFENGKVLNRKENFCFTGKMNAIFGKTDEEYRKYFNKTLNSEFVEKYVVELFQKIKKHQK